MSENKDILKIQKLSEKRKSDKIGRYLTSGDIDVVKAAINALGVLQDETSVNLLSPLIEDNNPEIRKAAAIAFANGGTEYAKTLLQHQLTKEKDENVKEVIRQSIHGIKFRY